jgi:hypothetical protein
MPVWSKVAACRPLLGLPCSWGRPRPGVLASTGPGALFEMQHGSLPDAVRIGAAIIDRLRTAVLQASGAVNHPLIPKE